MLLFPFFSQSSKPTSTNSTQNWKLFLSPDLCQYQSQSTNSCYRHRKKINQKYKSKKRCLEGRQKYIKTWLYFFSRLYKTAVTQHKRELNHLKKKDRDLWQTASLFQPIGWTEIVQGPWWTSGRRLWLALLLEGGLSEWQLGTSSFYLYRIGTNLKTGRHREWKGISGCENTWPACNRTANTGSCINTHTYTQLK